MKMGIPSGQGYMKKLPKKFLEEGLNMAKEAMIFGIPFEDLTKEELMAVAAQGWRAHRNLLKRRGLESGQTL